MIIQITTCQARNTHAVTEAVANHLAQHLNLDSRFSLESSWQERFQKVMTGQIQIGWICGYPYVQMISQPEPNL